MAGTKIGGLKAREKNFEKFGKDFYKVIGAKGGKASHTGGFGSNTDCVCELIDTPHKRQQCAGKKGGTRSRRTKAKK